MSRRAIFLDRDGTLVHPRHYPTQPEELEIFAGVPALLRRFQQAGWLLALITNQSGVARGLVSEVQLGQMHGALEARLGEVGVCLDGIYHCPHHPEGSVPPFNVECACRKPRPGMLLRAAHELQVDLAGSWFIGDILDDIEAGRRAGCRTALVDLGSEATPTTAMRTPDVVGRNTVHALAIIAAMEQLGISVGPPYLPTRWAPLGRSVGEAR